MQTINFVQISSMEAYAKNQANDTAANIIYYIFPYKKIFIGLYQNIRYIYCGTC